MEAPQSPSPAIGEDPTLGVLVTTAILALSLVLAYGKGRART